MDYLKNVKDTFTVWWDYKYLWLIGVIAVIFSSSGSPNFGSSNTEIHSDRFPIDNAQSSEFMSDILPGLLVTAGIICLGIVLIWIILSIYLGNVAHSAVIKTIPNALEKEKMGFMNMWRLGTPYWLKRFLLRVVLFAPLIFIGVILLAAFVFGIVLIGDTNPAIAFFLIPFAILSICLWSIAAMLVNILSTFAERKLILEDRGVWQSVTEGYNFFITNIAEIFISWVMTLPAIFLGWMLSVFLGLIFLLLFLLFIPVIIAKPVVGFAGLFIAIIFSSIVIAFIRGPIYALFSTYWSIVYLRLKNVQHESLTNQAF